MTTADQYEREWAAKGFPNRRLPAPPAPIVTIHLSHIAPAELLAALRKAIRVTRSSRLA